jgi:hypothetical protein
MPHDHVTVQEPCRRPRGEDREFTAWRAGQEAGLTGEDAQKTTRPAPASPGAVRPRRSKALVYSCRVQFEVEIYKNEVGEWVATAIAHDVSATGRTENEALALLMEKLSAHFKKA